MIKRNQKKKQNSTPAKAALFQWTRFSNQIKQFPQIHNPRFQIDIFNLIIH